MERIVNMLLSGFVVVASCVAVAQELEEVTVTAQKRTQALKDVPVSVTVLNAQQLTSRGITGTIDLAGGAIPALNVSTLGSSQSTLVVGMRGVSPADPSQITIEGSVGWYLDDIYLNRSQSLALDFIDVERIEVLSGPQGTLFGRNTIGGAVRIISKRPTGEFGVKQSIKVGRYDEIRSSTNINFPEISGVKTRLDYVRSQRDGWVDNTSNRTATNYTEFQKNGLRFSLEKSLSDNLNIFYAYDQADSDTVQYYHQFYEDSPGVFGAEKKRLSKTRHPVPALEPTKTDQSGHMVKLTWTVSEAITVNSLTSYRDLTVAEHTNFAGVLYFNGLDLVADIHQHQWSQEFQVAGSFTNVEWVSGLYHFDENADKTLQQFFTFDIFGNFGPPLTPIEPISSGFIPRVVELNNRSSAIYSQLDWNPDVFNGIFHVIAGVRYSDDKKTGKRTQSETHALDTGSDNTDVTLALSADIHDAINAYIKYSTGYKAAGANTQSDQFPTFDEEKVRTLEAGIKMDYGRFKVNTALFQSTYKDLQVNISNPANITAVETINAQKHVGVDGAEISLTAAPVTNMTIGLNYTWLEGDFPLQSDPFRPGEQKQYFVPQAPTHSGSLAIDYMIHTIPVGHLNLHVDVTSTDTYAYVPFSDARLDAWTLLNARIAWSGITLANGKLELALWGKNLTDEQYIVYAFPVGDPPLVIAQAFGDPITTGVSIQYQY